MATARENTLRAGLTAKKNQGTRPTKNPRSFTRLPDNPSQSRRNRLAETKNKGQRIKRIANAAGVGRVSRTQRISGWGGRIVGGAIGSWLPFVGTAAGAWLGGRLGKSVIGKWILIGSIAISLLAMFMFFIVIVGGIIVICENVNTVTAGVEGATTGFASGLWGTAGGAVARFVNSQLIQQAPEAVGICKMMV